MSSLSTDIQNVFVDLINGSINSKKPKLRWFNERPQSVDIDTDGLILNRKDLECPKGRDLTLNHCIFAEILDPFGLARRDAIDLNHLFVDDPSEAEKLLEKYSRQTEADIALSLELGAQGILYRLTAANLQTSTPMEYGGHYLENDRKILDQVPAEMIKILFLEGREVYFDFISDLPVEIFSWNNMMTDLDMKFVKHLSNRPIAIDHVNADIELQIGEPNV